jgi:hypothetical protein
MEIGRRRREEKRKSWDPGGSVGSKRKLGKEAESEDIEDIRKERWPSEGVCRDNLSQ